MNLSTATMPKLFSKGLGKYSHSTQPVGVGLVAIFVIAAAILFLGDTQVERNVLRSAGAEHERDLLRFSEVLHYSGLSITGPNARNDLPELALTSVFDRNVDRALFGLRAERMDIYTLEGFPIYSTDGVLRAPELSGGALEAFEAARLGQFTSFLRGNSSSLRDFGRETELLQSFFLVMDVPPDSVNTGRSLMVASLTTDVSDELNSAYATMWVIVGIFFFGSLVILLVVHWASVRSRARLQEANDALAEQYVAVRDSRERMIAAADSTKKAIAEELHGSVQTRLFSLWTRLSRVQSQSGGGPQIAVERDDLRQIIDELDDVRENEIRGLSHRLHPAIVRIGAAPALKSLCTRLSGDLNIQLSVDSSAAILEPAGSSTIPEPVRLAVFRIAELAIGNTVKHASATRCEVFWKYSATEQALRLIVEDDGIGFDPDGLTTSEFGGLGIMNIQDYTDSINGTAVLKSEPGWGTTLTVTVPFVPQELPQAGKRQGPGLEVRSNVTPFDQDKAA